MHQIPHSLFKFHQSSIAFYDSENPNNISSTKQYWIGCFSLLSGYLGEIHYPEYQTLFSKEYVGDSVCHHFSFSFALCQDSVKSLLPCWPVWEGSTWRSHVTLDTMLARWDRTNLASNKQSLSGNSQNNPSLIPHLPVAAWINILRAGSVIRSRFRKSEQTFFDPSVV